MKVEQIYSVVNDTTKEVLGKENVLKEDLSNIVDVGKEVFDSTAVDNYVKSLIDHIGKVVFADRPYSGVAPSVMMDSWEFGSVLEKVSADIPEATENDTWNLVDGKSYSQDVFHKPSVSAKFYNSKTTFEVPLSVTERQMKSAFSTAAQLNGFLSMLYNSVDKSLTLKNESLVMSTINNMTAATLYNEFPTVVDNDYSKVTGIKAVNLLNMYNTRFAKTLKAADCFLDADFCRYAALQMTLYQTRLTRISTLFNIGKKEKYTSADKLHTIMLSDFAKSADVYMQSDVWHNEYTKLPTAELVPFWQGSGTAYSFDNISKIHVNTPGAHEIQATGIIGVMFDRDALGVTNSDKRTTTAYNAKAEFYNNFYKVDASYFNDGNENFVVFFVA